MSTIRELVYNLRGLVKDSKSDDIDLSDRQYEYIINYLREKVVVQQLQKGRSVSSNLIQDLGQVKLELIDAGEGYIETDKYILKTSRAIPQPIEGNQMDLFTYIGGLDKSSPIPFKAKARAPWRKYTKYQSKIPMAYFLNQHIYIQDTDNLLENINIEGVFSNPREAFNFVYPDKDFDNERYPISGKLIDQINSLFKNQELSVFLQIVEDNTNDATPN